MSIGQCHRCGRGAHTAFYHNQRLFARHYTSSGPFPLVKGPKVLAKVPVRTSSNQDRERNAPGHARAEAVAARGRWIRGRIQPSRRNPLPGAPSLSARPPPGRGKREGRSAEHQCRQCQHGERSAGRDRNERVLVPELRAEEFRHP